MKSPLKLTIYILSWIITWLIFCSIINTGLIAVNVYSPGDKGSLITFSIGAAICIAGAASLFKELFAKDLNDNEEASQ